MFAMEAKEFHRLNFEKDQSDLCNIIPTVHTIHQTQCFLLLNQIYQSGGTVTTLKAVPLLISIKNNNKKKVLSTV